VLGTVGTGSLPSPARLGYQPSAGTSLLDNKRGVPVARSLGGQETRKKWVQVKKVIKTVIVKSRVKEKKVLLF
jgi:hypothetical protein